MISRSSNDPSSAARTGHLTANLITMETAVNDLFTRAREDKRLAAKIFVLGLLSASAIKGLAALCAHERAPEGLRRRAEPIHSWLQVHL